MQQCFQSVGELRLLLEQIGIEIHEMLGDHIKKTAEEGPTEKRKNYPAASYQDQIERNAVYLHESTLSLIAAIVDYLRSGRPLLRTPDQINAFVAQTRINRAQQVTLLHVSYIRYGCAGCGVHAEHAEYATLRRMVEAQDLATYIDQIEFDYVFYQASMMIAANYLATLLNHHELAGCARMLSSEKVRKVVVERLFLRTHGILDNIAWESAQQPQAVSKPMGDQEAKRKKGWPFRK